MSLFSFWLLLPLINLVMTFIRKWTSLEDKVGQIICVAASFPLTHLSSKQKSWKVKLANRADLEDKVGQS